MVQVPMISKQKLMIFFIIKPSYCSFKDGEGNWLTRRFLFSKWTLREGWDNPNVFVICKLRTSGSENSKIQEVGRGLRLPVDEKGPVCHTRRICLSVWISSLDMMREILPKISGRNQQRRSN